MSNLPELQSRFNSSLGREELFDPLRAQWVWATPEEYVRQNLISMMVHTLGYSQSLLGSEISFQSLASLLSISCNEFPQRRIDLVYFTKNSQGLIPFILIECKAVPLNRKVFTQVVGYHRHWQTPLLIVANQKEIYTGRYNQTLRRYDFFLGIWHHDDLVHFLAEADRP